MTAAMCLLRRFCLFAAVFSVFGAVVSADWVERRVAYTDGNTDFEGVLVYREGGGERPGILMVPNWMGVTPASVEKAKRIAGGDYVIFVADLYGADVRPANAEEAGAAAGEVRADRAMMRARARLGLDTLLGSAAPVDAERTAAIGFCFGGGTVLELGRSGAPVDAVVSFHGDLASPTLEADAGANRGSVLVLHGAEDPYVPQEDVRAFVAAMRGTGVDWQLVQFSETVHSFTDPAADAAGRAAHNPRSARRAYRYMDALFDELF